MSSVALPLAGKVAIVTGGSKGIGRATSLRLARDGAKVVVNYASSAKDAEEVVSTIGAENAIAIKADVGKVEEINRLVDEVVAKWGKIDILVASAGVMKLAELEAGPLFLTQKAAPHMAPGSRVVLFSTTQATASTVTPNYLVYIMTKGAIEQATRALSKDLSRKGITVNACAPGPTATDLFLTGKSEQMLKMAASAHPQGRIGKPDEIADVVAFLSGPEAGWVSGQTLYTNGGLA